MGRDADFTSLAVTIREEPCMRFLGNRACFSSFLGQPVEDVPVDRANWRQWDAVWAWRLLRFVAALEYAAQVGRDPVRQACAGVLRSGSDRSRNVSGGNGDDRRRRGAG